MVKRSALSAQPKPTALIDTREQHRLQIIGMPSEIATLTTGDYSVRGLEHVIAIERKSAGDMLACIGQERDRFEREVQRLLAYPVRALVIEAGWQYWERGEWQSKVTSKAAIGSMLGWIAAGLPIIQCYTHERAGEYVSRLLYTAARRRWREARALVGDALDLKLEEGAVE